MITYILFSKLVLVFYASRVNDQGHIVLGMSICLSFCLSECQFANFNHNCNC